MRIALSAVQYPEFKSHILSIVIFMFYVYFVSSVLSVQRLRAAQCAGLLARHKLKHYYYYFTLHSMTHSNAYLKAINLTLETMESKYKKQCECCMHRP